MTSSQGLRCRTVNDASPHGKPRVYLCCHPDDFPSFVGSLTAELLEAQATAAVWYRDPEDGEADERAHLDDLSRMQLFVIPVTSRFLSQDSFARVVELPHALACHIPVLPILEEPGLAEAFDQVCGDLQCLDRHASEADPTALPFRQRFTEFVNHVLVGDQLSARIRAAFDAYVFLSYRKKDRASAQHVMDLIHQVDALRDVAIWYDEFLVPGEGFNDAIFDALEASRLVALVVTPSLLEDQNYVMTTEYPQACRYGKPVLPIEAVPTDADVLSRCYPGIGEAVPADDGMALEERLVPRFDAADLGKGAGDPEHDYLIGLAYLMGIDVEVNRERALRLITGAAEAGHLEALERLVWAYRMGEGVTRDHGEAIAWQERLVEALRTRADERPVVENLQELYLAYSHLGDYKRDARDLAGARAAYSRMTSCAERLRKAGDPDAQHKKFVALAKLGIIDGFDDKLDMARFWHGQAIGGLEALVADGAGADVRRILATEYGNLGIIFSREGKGGQARVCTRHALLHAEDLAEVTGSVEDRRIVAKTCELMGDLCREEEDATEARAWLERSCETWKAVVGETAQPEDWSDWATTLEKLGDLLLEQGQLGEARTCHQQSYLMREAVEKKLGSASARHDLARSCWSLGAVCESEDDLDGALGWYGDAVGLLCALVRDTHADVETHEYGSVCSDAGDVAMKQGNYPLAETWFRRSADAFEMLVARSDQSPERRLLAAAYSKRGDTHFYRRDCEAARPWYLRAYRLRRQLVDQEGTEGQLRELWLSTIRLAKTYHNEGDYEGARAWYEQALAVRKSLARKSGALDDWDALLQAYHDLAELPGVPAEERRTYLEGIASLAFQLYQASGSDQHAAYLIYAQEQLATS